MNVANTFSTLATVAAMVLLTVSGAVAKTDLLVYTAVEADEMRKFKNAFEADHPEITIKWVHGSAGHIASRLLAEKDDPQADVVWGVAASSLLMLAARDYFQGYAPTSLDKLDKAFYDAKNNPPLWIGQRAWTAAICYNTVAADRHRVPLPARWADLTKAAYKGHVIMPNPISSVTGFMDVSSWIQTQGETEAWRFMDALHENIARYTHSGAAPCRLAARGAVPIGISYAYRGAMAKTAGAPLEVIAPADGVGWDLEAFAIVRDTENLAAARAFADWSVSETAHRLYNEAYAILARPGIARTVKNLPPGIENKMIHNDLQWAADNRARILEAWRQRYDGKSDPPMPAIAGTGAARP